MTAAISSTAQGEQPASGLVALAESLEASGYAVLALDADCHAALGPMARRLFAFAVQHRTASRETMLRRVHPADRALFSAALDPVGGASEGVRRIRFRAGLPGIATPTLDAYCLSNADGAGRMFVFLKEAPRGRRRAEPVEDAGARDHNAPRLTDVSGLLDSVVIELDRQWRVTWAAPGASWLFGRRRGQILNASVFSFLLYDRPVRRPEALARRFLALAGGSLYGFEARIRSACGEIRHVSINVRANGQGYIASLTDITAFKRKESQLREARREAELREDALAEQFTILSHEIRTPLNAAIGNLELLCARGLAPDLARYARDALAAGEHLLWLINALLDHAKLDAEEQPVASDVLSLHALLDDVSRIMEVQAERQNLYLRFEVATPGLDHVLGDASRLRQVLINLIGNAIKFTETGGVRVRAYRDQPDWVRFEVIDTGPGIPDHERARLFNRFFQGAAGQSKGTGLGLAICKSLVKRMDGEIGVESAVGRGSTFWFTAPLAGVEAPETADRAAAGAAEPETVEAPAPAAGETASGEPGELDAGPQPVCAILVAEDNRASQEVARAILSALGHQVTVAADGAEAVARAGEQTYSVILMDVEMPNQDGFAAAAEIRAGGGPNAQTPIVALTAHTLSSIAQRQGAEHFNSFLTKPLRIEELRDTVARYAHAAGALDRQENRP